MCVALLLGAAGCASTPASPPPNDIASAPQPLEGHDWFLSLGDDRPGLMYGAENSDDVWLVLTCEPGASVITLTQPAIERHPIRVESGGDTETYPAETAPSDLHDHLLTARAEKTDPVFQRFRRVGWLATWTDGQRAMMVPQPGSVGRIESFFAACA